MGYTIPNQSFHSSHIRSTTKPHTYTMNPATVFSAVVTVLSVGSANAFFGADIVTGTGALFSGTGGTHVILAGGTAGAVAPVAAVAGAAILLKAGALLYLNQAGRSKRSAEESDAIFTTIAAAEPASCVKQLICDIATPVTSPKSDFAVAATLGKQLKSVEACELRYT